MTDWSTVCQTGTAAARALDPYSPLLLVLTVDYNRNIILHEVSAALPVVIRLYPTVSPAALCLSPSVPPARN